jgi:predicted ATPase
VIQSSPTMARQFKFGHALIQQTVYEEFSPMGKMRMHSTIADALEQRYETGVDGHAAELAHHFAEAGTSDGKEKAISYSLIAGEYALSTFAYEQALNNFTRVLTFKNGGMWMTRQPRLCLDSAAPRQPYCLETNLVKPTITS